MHHELVKDLDHIGLCWHQLNVSVTPKLHVAMSHLPYLLQSFNGGFNKLKESRMEASHQSRTRDDHRLARMKDEDLADKFEAKLQNARANKNINKAQSDVCNFTKRRLSAQTSSLQKRRKIENRNIKVAKINVVKEESKTTDSSTRHLTIRKRKLTSIIRPSS